MTMSRIERYLRTAILAASVFLPSCATLPKYDVPKQEYTVAVLPVYNETADLDGPVMLRKMFDEKIRPYYKTIPIDTVDAILRDRAGVTLGGQLAAIDPRKLGEILGVDGLVYGYLLNFDDVKTVFYNVRKVRAAFKLVDVKTGDTVWARGQGVRSIGGMLDMVPADESLQEFIGIKGIERIPGINEWHDRVNIPGMLKSDPRSAILIPFMAAADTVLSLGRQFAGNIVGTHLYVFADDVTDRILYEVLKGRFALLDRPAEARKLIFPVFALYKDKDFMALAVLRIKDLSTGGETAAEIVLMKKGGLLRSDRTIGENTFSVIVDSNAREGRILFPDSGHYTELDLKEANFADVHIEKVFLGDAFMDGRVYDTYRLAVIYGDTSIQEGMLWESHDPMGMIKKIRLRSLSSRIVLEFVDVGSTVPSDDAFKVPAGYVRMPEQ